MPVAATSARTFTPDVEHYGQLIDLVSAMRERGLDPQASPALVTADGHRHEIPPEIADLFASVLEPLSEGRAITVMPTQRLLTTQEAADLLGISRPTFIKALERGDLPHEMRGRHRRIRLGDLMAYQQRLADTRREALSSMARDAEAANLYDRLDGPPPATR